MKKPPVTRRKFLTGIGVVAGAATLKQATNSFATNSTEKRNLLDAWSEPPPVHMPKYKVILEPKMLRRAPGTYLLPLAQRPV